MNDHIHVGHGPRARLVLLAVQLQRRRVFFLGGPQFSVYHKTALNKKTGGTTAGVINVHAWLRVHDASYDEADLCRRVEFAGALTAAFGELADEVFVAATDYVGLHIGKSEALGADFLDEVRETVIVNIALTVGNGVEVDAINDSLE